MKMKNLTPKFPSSSFESEKATQVPIISPPRIHISWRFLSHTTLEYMSICSSAYHVNFGTNGRVQGNRRPGRPKLMYCPKCSQQQLSEDLRYCSRCGFPLEPVGLLLSNNGVLPQPPTASPTLSRSRVIRESLIMTVVAWLLGLGATFWFDAGGPFEVIAKVGALVFFLLGLIGLGRFVYAFMLFRDSPEIKLEVPAVNVTTRDRTTQALPQPQQVPVSDWQRSENTKEIVGRPSVTEGTTRLLKDDE